jgi:putative two-component system response regulator
MPTVLIVDDEPRYAETARKALVREGCGVHMVHSVDEARQFLMSALPDAIILDILFRKAAGTELLPLGCDFLDELKADERTKAIPVVMLTMIADGGMEKRCRAAGAADYIRKNAGGKTILASLRNVGLPLGKQAPPTDPMILALGRVLRGCLPNEGIHYGSKSPCISW